MSQSPSSASIAAMVGVLGSSWVAGGIATLSLFTMPGLLSVSLPARVLAKQWEIMYNRGKITMPAVATISLLAFAYSAYDQRRRGLDWRRYAIAGAFTAGIMPFTAGLMWATNQALLRVASGAPVGVGDEVTRDLVKKWSDLNLVRSLFPYVGAVVGLWSFAG